MTVILMAIALVFVIEGLVPFAAPNRYRQFVAQIVRLGDNSLRVAGLISILFGLVMLFIVRSLG